MHRAHDYPHLAARWQRLARTARLRIAAIARADGYPVLRIETPALQAEGGIYLSAGIHGDEPGSTEGLIAWAERHGKGLRDLPLLMLPCLNPWGLVHNRRSDAAGNDLNRCWHGSRHPVVRGLRQHTAAMRFRVAACLHEDYDAQGVYIYEPIRREPLWGPELLRAARPHLSPDPRRIIDGRRPNRPGLISRRVRPALFRSIGYPEAVWLHFERADRTFTLETPSEAAIESRSAAQVAMLDALLDLWHHRRR